ncbi:methyl farnesoate epoxidase-like [Ischnura elegans]|uniref:methyl farnesoate epoxidase-like n=1 Tax=Ischnura elegans TaxID=197161 RepID=UPI001ED87F09|nr:methyl farnesoate epoxidase-like [Ischnura elegans]
MIPRMAPEFLVPISAAVLFALWIMCRKPKKFPPGPRRWPIFGYVPIIFAQRAKDITSYLHKKYGRVVGLHVLNIPVVFISGLDEVREALLRDDFSGRPEYINISIFGGKSSGIILTSGDIWKLQRRFVLQHLRQLGLGKNTLEGIVQEEIRAMMIGIEEMSGGCENGYLYPVDFKALLGAVSINVLWHIVMGKRFDYRDPKFIQLMEAAKSIFNQNSQQIFFYNLFPFLAKLLPSSFGFQEFESSVHCLHDAIEGEMDSHKEVIDYDHPQDFMDIYLCEIEKQKDSLDRIFNVTQLKEVCAELFMAGTDTTTNNLSFAILNMILYPRAQRKAQQEIDEVIGRDRLPSLSDRDRLPYVEAIIQEVLRLSSVAPTAFPHSVVTSEKHVTFRGYHIPKGSVLIIDFYGVHHDPEIWKCPDMFIPERFLRKNGGDILNEAIYPFSGGKRGCPGETFARNNIFLILTSILQRYSLEVPEGQPLPSSDPIGNTVLFPKPFTVKVQRRF